MPRLYQGKHWLEVGGGLSVHELPRIIAAGVAEARVETREVSRVAVIGTGSENGPI